MTRTPQQARNLDNLLDHFHDADEAAEFVAAAAFEAAHDYGFAPGFETYAAMAAGASWIVWWAGEMRQRGKLSEVEHAKMVGVARMAASVWATNARDFRAFEEVTA